MNLPSPLRFWKKVFPGKTTDPPLAELLQTFVNTHDRAAKKALLNAHPQLLDPRADAILVYSASLAANAAYRAAMEQNRVFLSLCREVGVEAAFTPVPATPPGTPLGFVVQALINTPTMEGKKALINAHPELLAEGIGERFPRTADERVAAVMNQYRQLLEMCRAVGVDAAFQEVERRRCRPPRDWELQNRLGPVLGAANLDEMEAAIRAEPRIIEWDVRESLRIFMAMKGGGDIPVERLQACLEILHACDRQGIAAAFDSLWNRYAKAAPRAPRSPGVQAETAFNQLIGRFKAGDPPVEIVAEACRVMPDLPVLPRRGCMVLAMLCSARAGDYAQARQWVVRLNASASAWGTPGLPDRSAGPAVIESTNVDPILETLETLRRAPADTVEDRNAIESLIGRYTAVKNSGVSKGGSGDDGRPQPPPGRT